MRIFQPSSSSSIGTATLVGFGLLNYRWVFSAGRFLQSAVASGTSNHQLGGPMIRKFQLPPPGVPHVWNTRKVELWTRKRPRIFPRVATSSLLGSFTCPKFTTRDRLLYFPSEGRRAEDFFARKIRRLWPGLNPWTRVPEASTLTSTPPKPLYFSTLKTYNYVMDASHNGYRLRIIEYRGSNNEYINARSRYRLSFYQTPAMHLIRRN